MELRLEIDTEAQMDRREKRIWLILVDRVIRTWERALEIAEEEGIESAEEMMDEARENCPLCKRADTCDECIVSMLWVVPCSQQFAYRNYSRAAAVGTKEQYKEALLRVIGELHQLRDDIARC